MGVNLEYVELIPKILEKLEEIGNLFKQQETKRWLSARELAKYLDYSEDKIHKLKSTVLIEDYHWFKPSGKILFDREKIDSWIKGESRDYLPDTSIMVQNILASLKS